MTGPVCGAPHHQHPETHCTQPADHYRPNTDPHAGPLILNGRQCGAAAWDEPRHQHPKEQHVPEEPCPFCEIVAGRAPATVIEEWPHALAIVPLNPVVEGHTLVIPKKHVTDFTESPFHSARTMAHAAMLAATSDRPMNLITSRGREATQSVFHLHLHLVPRAANDGLALPWYSGRRSTRKARA